MIGAVILAAAAWWALIRTGKAWYYHDVKNKNDGRWNRV